MQQLCRDCFHFRESKRVSEMMGMAENWRTICSLYQEDKVTLQGINIYMDQYHDIHSSPLP